MSRILLVEDEKEIRDIIVDLFSTDQIQVTAVGCLKDAGQQLVKGSFDLILLDVGLPDGDGFQFCSQLRLKEETKNTPVIFLTGRADESDTVMGFQLGAVDYISKPFRPMELQARVQSRLRSKNQEEVSKIVLRKGNLKIYVSQHRVCVTENGREKDIHLTPIEFRILLCLAEHEDVVFSREQIISKIHGAKLNLTDRSIDTHVFSLRKKLTKKFKYIKTVYGEGYRFKSEAA